MKIGLKLREIWLLTVADSEQEGREGAGIDADAWRGLKGGDARVCVPAWDSYCTSCTHNTSFS